MYTITKRSAFLALTTAGLISGQVNASPITAIDLASVDLGAKIVGPVGPDVEVSLINVDGDSVGDLRSSVSCPTGFVECLPPSNPVGLIYTYTHTVIPGLDNPNDAPFPNPPTVLSFDDVNDFTLGFSATGFNGVAGYSFNEASIAGVNFEITLNNDNQIVWQSLSDNWDTGEAVTFFWQTTQAPSGPGGVFNVSNDAGGASGRGPLPRPIVVEVSAPATTSVLMAFGLGLLALRKRH